MELNAEEIAHIETMRKSKAEKEERERLAARSSKDKALEIFVKKAAQLNALANNLVAEVTYLNRAITYEFGRSKTDTATVCRGEYVTTEECGFTDFAPIAVQFTLSDSTVVVRLNNPSGSSWNHYEKINAYTIDSCYYTETKVYHSEVDKKCAKILVDRLNKLIAYNFKMNLKEKREAKARIHIAAKYPSAREVCIAKYGEYGDVKYEAKKFSGCHEYSSIKGVVSFVGETLEVKSTTWNTEAVTYYDDKTLIEFPREAKIKAMQTEMNEKINALKKEFNAESRKVMCEAWEA